MSLKMSIEIQGLTEVQPFSGQQTNELPNLIFFMESSFFVNV